MKNPKNSLLLLLSLSFLSLFACGDDDDDQPEATTVTVVMKEHTLTPDVATAAAGTITFVAKNEGAVLHELVLIRTDLAAGELPLLEDGTVNEEAEGLTVVGEVEDVAAGAQGEFTVTVTPGKYVLICNIENHYTQGMYTTFTVQ